MQVGVTVLGHVIIEHDVDTLDIHSPAKQICGHQDPFAETFECLIFGQPGGEEITVKETAFTHLKNKHSGTS